MCEESAPEGAVGRRVAVQRKLAGLTQQQLAARAHVSKSLVSQVERGEVPASAAFTATAARALGIDVETLTGQPYGPPITDPGAEHAGIPALRMALDNDEDPDFEGFPMPVTELRTRLDECEVHRENSRYSRVIATLPELLNHASAIVNNAQPGHDAETAWALIDDCYELAHRVSHQFGYFDLAALAARYGRDTAARAGDPLRAAAAAFRSNSVRRHRGDYPGALRVIDRGLALIESERSPAADAVRAGCRSPPDAEPVRAGRYQIDVTRAWTLHGNRAKALDALNQARAVAPQLTRYHPGVRETVHLLAETDRRATDSLAGFARWAGITL